MVFIFVCTVNFVVYFSLDVLHEKQDKLNKVRIRLRISTKERDRDECKDEGRRRLIEDSPGVGKSAHLER